jgi:hypothetical protein
VAVWNDVVVVGAPLEDGSGASPMDNGAIDSGAVYVFEQTNGSWFQSAYLKPNVVGENDEFGFAVSLEGAAMLVGAPGEGGSATGVNGDAQDEGTPAAGAAYAFGATGSSWFQAAYLKPSNPDPADLFGFAVANSSGGYVVTSVDEASQATGIDGDQSDNSAEGAGACYVFSPGVIPLSPLSSENAKLVGEHTTQASSWGAWQAMGSSGVSIRFCRVTRNYVTWMFRNDRSPTIRSMDFKYNDRRGIRYDLIPFSLKPGQAFGGWAAFLADQPGTLTVTLTRIVRR